MQHRTLVALVCLVLFAQSGRADELLLTNGDRLTGRIVHLIEGKLLFKSEQAGDVTVNLSSIQTFSTDGPITVNLKDGTSFTQKVLSAAAGLFAVQGRADLKAQQFAVADIVAINPPASKWTGDISVSVTSTHGNTRTDAIGASANFTKRTKQDRTTINADYAKSEQRQPDTGETVTTEDWWRLNGKYDYFFSKKLYGYVNGRYEKDAVAKLDRRVIVGLGGGYQWIESNKMNFSTELGLASLYEKFTNQTDSHSEISLQAGYHFDMKLMDNVKLTHSLTYFPAVDKFSDYFLTSTAGIRADVTDKLFMVFKAILNYDTTPAIGAGRTDTKYFLGLGYKF